MLRYIFVLILCIASCQAVAQAVDSIEVPKVEFSHDYFYTAIDSVIYRDSVAFNRKRQIDEAIVIFYWLGRFDKDSHYRLTDYERKTRYHLFVSFGRLKSIEKSAHFVGYLHYRGFKVLVCGPEAFRIVEEDPRADSGKLKLYFYEMLPCVDDFAFPNQIYEAKIKLTNPDTEKKRPKRRRPRKRR